MIIKLAALTVLFAATLCASASAQVRLTLDGSTIVKESFWTEHPPPSSGTDIDAANITSGILDIGRLPPSVPLLDGSSGLTLLGPLTVGGQTTVGDFTVTGSTKITSIIPVSGDSLYLFNVTVPSYLFGTMGSLALITPTGTADSTTFLRGDGVWASPPAGTITASYGLLAGDGSGGAVLATSAQVLAMISGSTGTFNLSGLTLSLTAAQIPLLTATQIPALPESKITNLATDLALKAPLASPTFTGTVTLPDSSVTKASNSQSIFGTSGNVLYLYTGTSGLQINNQANTATLLSLTNAGALTLGGTFAASSVNINAATNPALNYGGSLFLTRTAAATVAVGSAQGGTDGTEILSNVTSAGSLTLSAGGTNQDITVNASGSGKVQLTNGGGNATVNIAGNVLTFFASWTLARASNSLGYIVSSGSLADLEMRTLGFGASAGTLDAGLSRNAAGVVEVNNGTVGTLRDLKLRQLIVDPTVTAAGTTGAQTINKARGTVRLAAGASSIVVTDSLVSSTSKAIARGLGAFDATATNFQVTCSSGSLTINANAAATSETEVLFDLVIP